jgi:hypothetical protein
LIAGGGTERYVKPLQEEMDDFEAVVAEMMAGASQSGIAGSGACADIPLLSLDGKYQIDVFTDTEYNKDYCVLATTSMDYAWGTIIVNQADFAKNLSIDSVHPKYDSYTGEQSIAVFKGTDARSFMVSGAQKYANAELSECDGDNNVADVAHTINCFQSAAKAIMDYYDSHESDYTAIQFHAMAMTSCEGVDGYFTNGGAFAPFGEKINMFRQEVASVMVGTFTIPGELPYCGLTGGTNVQGRMINGIDPVSACTVKPHSYTGRFIHLETKSFLRDQSPELHALWADAVNNAYARFTSAEPPRGIKILSPNGFEIIGQGTLVPITWDENRLGDDEELHLSVGTLNDNGSFNYVQGIAYGSSSKPYAINGEGSYNWRVRTALSEGDYVVRVRAVSITLPGLMDFSDTAFSVVKPLALTNPNGGEAIPKQATHEIKWDVRSGGVPQVYISLHTGANHDFDSAIATVPNTGSYMWPVPASLASANDYTIRIRNPDYTYANDYSDAQFSIVDPVQDEPAQDDRFIAIASPNGGETIGQGTLVDVSWEDNSLGADELLQISVGKIQLDGSYQYVQGIAYGGSNNPYAVNSAGVYSWRVRTALQEGNYVIRIRPISSVLQTFMDFSYSEFSVVKPLALANPNGGEQVQKGNSYEIKWYVRAAGVSHVYISLHENANKAWHSKIATVPNTGSYMWAVPASLASADDYTIRIRNPDYTASNDYSDSTFSIVD